MRGRSQHRVRALNNHPDINPETKKMILKTVEESNFVPNNSARNLKRTDSKSIAILVKEIDNPFFATMMRVMEKKIRRQKYSFFIQHITSGGAYVDKMVYCSQISDLIAAIIIYFCGFVLFFAHAAKRQGRAGNHQRILLCAKAVYPLPV